MSVTCNSSEDNRDLTIRVIGRFDYRMVWEFRATYADKQYLNYIINLSATDHMDSSALGMLLSMRSTLGDNAKITIVRCRPRVKKVFEVSDFDELFNIES